jgi:octanoyl-[GcvH]:protein N-octanoyltransferase
MTDPRRVSSVEDARAVLLSGVDELRVAVDSDLGSASADLAVGPTLLRTVAGMTSTGWLRTYRPVPTLAFSRRDTLAPGYSHAQAAAAQHGFEPAARAPGGRAAAYHRSSLCFELVLPGERSPVQHISALGELVAGVLRDFGVDARVGEVPGEYCPGRFSVNAGGVSKIVGTAGRRVRGALLLGGSIIVADADPIRAVLTAVYSALELPLDPRTVASAVDHGCVVDDAAVVGHALSAALTTDLRVIPTNLPDPPPAT